MATLAQIDRLVGSLCVTPFMQHAVASVPPESATALASPSALLRLGDTERRLLAQLRSPKRRSEFYAGRIAAKDALRRFCPGELVASEIGKDGLGAPFVLNGPKHVHVSISHSESFAVAIVASVPVGIDLEQDEPRPSAFGRFFLTMDERTQVERAGATDGNHLVNHFWCRKEAACKVGGWGATLPFGTLDTSQSETQIFGHKLHITSSSADGFVVGLAWLVEPSPLSLPLSHQGLHPHG